MPILIATSLLDPHPFEFAFRFGCVLVLALHFNDQRLLLCEPPLSFDDVALDLAQLIVYRRRVHRDPRAAVLPSTPQSSFRLLQSLIRTARCGLVRNVRHMTFNSTSFANVPADAIFSQARFSQVANKRSAQYRRSGLPISDVHPQEPTP
ncbi:hypothetical protein [Bradyrhizobium sp. WSM471]|uniref:hypothetical protein n=1 Tax=Bradyrhizobium sp. WSM471 TaxID=319017 RepID=UPI0018DEECE4|nr:MULTISPECIES: hypothetical protein [Bradyrhizobium]UFW43642.1 hypothetical protein BcanWSM471_11470 [Bradyrhizobium canariense]